jgi:succinoglycan biosynthesis protein ExoA
MSGLGVDIPTASIIIPVLNQEKALIGRCIQSLVEQEYPSDMFEIVVVDGSDEDATVEMLKELARLHKNIKLVKNPQRSLADAMKIGIAHATGDMVLRGDVRILYMSDYIESCIHSSRKAYRILTGI